MPSHLQDLRLLGAAPKTPPVPVPAVGRRPMPWPGAPAQGGGEQKARTTEQQAEAARLATELNLGGDFDDDPTIDERMPPEVAALAANENAPEPEDAAAAGRRIADAFLAEEAPAPAPEKKGFWGGVWSGLKGMVGLGDAPAAAKGGSDGFAAIFDRVRGWDGATAEKTEKMAGMREAILGGGAQVEADILDKVDPEVPDELKDKLSEDLPAKLEKMRAFLATDAGKAMSDEDLVALVGYTGGDFRKINKALRGKLDDGDAAALGPYIEKVKSALAKLPPAPGTSYRGMAMSPERLESYLEKCETGEPVDDQAFSSSSAHPEGAQDFIDRNAEPGKVNVMVEIRGQTGRDVTALSDNPHEQEVLFAPGTRFKVVDRVRVGGSWRFVLEEIGGGEAEGKGKEQERRAS